MKKRSGEIDYDEILLKDLQDPKEARAYLNVALQDEDPRMFLIALRNVLRATGKGMTTLAQETDLNRESLYRSLSKRGNPQIKNVVSILRSLDLQLGVHSIGKR